MLTLEEIVDLEMATEAYNVNVQSKTPYSDLTQVVTSQGGAPTDQLSSRPKNTRRITLSDQ